MRRRFDKNWPLVTPRSRIKDIKETCWDRRRHSFGAQMEHRLWNRMGLPLRQRVFRSAIQRGPRMLEDINA